MIFPGSGQVDYAALAAQRRFSRSLWETERSHDEMLLAGQTALEEARTAGEEKWRESVARLLDDLRQAVSASNDAADDALKFAREESARQEKVLKPLADDLAKLRDSLARFTPAVLDTLAALARWWPGRDKSAGGLVAQEELGFPFATGTILWTFNVPPKGWLTCNGTWVRIADYPELYDTIRSANYGVNDQGLFRLPSKSQCPGYAAGLAAGLRAIIRT